MLEKSFGLLYFLKNSGSEPKKFIYLLITVDGHLVEVSTKRQWWENRWDQEKGRASGVKEDARELNFFMDTLEKKAPPKAHRGARTYYGGNPAGYAGRQGQSQNDSPDLCTAQCRHEGID